MAGDSVEGESGTARGGGELLREKREIQPHQVAGWLAVLLFSH